MATSSFPCPFFAGPPPFPSTFTTAATYHHLSPHGFSPAHTPDSYFSPPPFGFGATASGFFPAPAYDPSILPFSTTYKPDSRSHPFTPSDQISPTPPPPSAHPLSPPSSLLLHRTNLCSPTPQLLDTIPTPTTHADLPYSKADEATKNSPSPPSATAEIRDDFAHHDPTVGHRRSTRSQNRIATAAEEAALLEAAHAQAMEEEAISARLPREILNIQRRLKQQQSSVDLLQGNISKLTDMVSQISLAVVRRPDSSEQEPMVTNQNSSPFSTPTPHATQLSPIMEGTTPNPTPTSQLRPSQSTPQQQQAIHFGNLAPTRFPHPEFPPQTLPPTPTASAPLMFCAAASSSASSPSDASTAAYVAPQEFGEMPQRYGLQSLSRQSIFLSDDSEHSYYARPEKYNLEQATSEPVFDVYAGEKDGSSTDFVDVLASLQEQHTHEDQQTYGSIEYNHSNNEIELPSVTNSELCTELGKAQVHNHEWNMLLTEKREEWDPGIRKTLMDISQVAKLFSFTLVSSPLSMLWDPGASLISIKARQLDQTLQTSIHASTLVDKLHGQENVAPLAGSSVTGFNRYTCLSFWVQYKFYVLWKSEIGMTTCISWDPGIRHYMAPNGIISVHQDNSFIMLRAAHFSECKYPCSLYCKCMLKTEYCPSRCLSEISVSCLKRLRWNPGDFTHMLLVLCVSCREITDNCFADLKLMANTSSKLAALTWHSSLSGTPFLLLSSTTYTWEPGVQCIIDRLLDKFIESNQVQSVQQIRYRAASVWDPGTMLPWYKITVRVNSEHNSFSTAKFNGGKAAYSSKIPTSCLSASFKEEKEMGRMIPEQWRFGFHAMHYCQIFQKCNAMSSQFYWNQDIKFNGIALWMITFNPP